jgi:hypothetical protein
MGQETGDEFVAQTSKLVRGALLAAGELNDLIHAFLQRALPQH